jgi:hypothetical protein
MAVTRLSCGRCGSALEGSFQLAAPTQGPARRSGPLAPRAEIEARFGRLARLNANQHELVETILRCRGVIKNVEDMLGISYPTVKARLTNVLEAMGFAGDEDRPDSEERRARREILADLAAGRITTEEAHRLLAQQAPGTQADEEDDED